MSQNPYANPYPQQYGQAYPPGYSVQPPARTSALAVTSLVLSLLCCTAPLGVVFGGLALLGIGMSGGKVKGVGVAIAGLIIGIILTALWIGAIVGFGQIFGMFGTMIEPAIKGLEARDTQVVQQHFVTSAQSSLDDARIEEFATLIENEYGQYDRMPDGVGEVIGEFSNLMTQTGVGPATQTAQQRYGQNGTFPMPVKFDSGWHAIMIAMDSGSSASPGPNGMPLLRDIGIVKSDGTLVWLVADAGGGGQQLPHITPHTPRQDEPGAGGDDEGGDAGGDLPAPTTPEPRTNRTNRNPK